MNIFERASRAQLLFPTTRGFITTEDLWTLSLESLNNIAKGVNKKLKESQEESFISVKTSEDTLNDLRLEILKHIIASKLADEERGKKIAETKAKKERIQQLIMEKQDKNLGEKSVEELTAMLNELGE